MWEWTREKERRSRRAKKKWMKDKLMREKANKTEKGKKLRQRTQNGTHSQL